MTDKKIQIPVHGSNVSRADIPEACKWHVQDIYVDEAAWHKACAEFKELLPGVWHSNFNKFAPQLGLVVKTPKSRNLEFIIVCFSCQNRHAY